MSFFRSFFPEAASSIAGPMDTLFIVLVVVCGLVTLGVYVAILWLAIRYRAGSSADRTGAKSGSWPLETTWSLIPLAIFLCFFVWGARLYASWAEPPPGALQVYVVGKQWMWHIQHPEGRREIDELHLPLGRPVVVTMTSEDVIHDFFVPAFRIKQDVLPGRYTRVWFTPTKAGRYHLFCSQYCGTEHASMGGWVTVMEPAAYQEWLSGGVRGPSMAQEGAALFSKYSCTGCHGPAGRGPELARVAHAGEDELRASIVRPKALMPSYRGQIGERDMLQLIVYIEGLAP